MSKVERLIERDQWVTMTPTEVAQAAREEAWERVEAVVKAHKMKLSASERIALRTAIVHCHCLEAS